MQQNKYWAQSCEQFLAKHFSVSKNSSVKALKYSFRLIKAGSVSWFYPVKADITLTGFFSDPDPQALTSHQVSQKSSMYLNCCFTQRAILSSFSICMPPKASASIHYCTQLMEAIHHISVILEMF